MRLPALWIALAFAGGILASMNDPPSTRILIVASVSALAVATVAILCKRLVIAWDSFGWAAIKTSLPSRPSSRRRARWEFRWSTRRPARNSIGVALRSRCCGPGTGSRWQALRGRRCAAENGSRRRGNGAHGRPRVPRPHLRRAFLGCSAYFSSADCSSRLRYSLMMRRASSAWDSYT